MTSSYNKAPIGVFDSGVGGLTVLSSLNKLMPNENFIYLGDTARVPYGTKSPDSVVRYALQAGQALVNEGIKMLVIACNTATAVSLDALSEKFDPIPIVGVVEPGAQAACAASTNGRIAVIATPGTVKGGVYQKTICRMHPEAQIIAQGCALFVGLAEEGWTEGELVEGIAARYIEPLLEKFGENQPDTLVLGCTHFPVLKNAIRNVVGSEINMVDSADTTALRVRNILNDLEIANTSEAKGQLTFLATDCAESFASVGSRFLGTEIDPEQVRIVDI